eukprot:TRINITY_DN6951_c0_g1_i1.p1 TRINITY_DN6951_c0_g1~~TRINITY_DN6951_c0_g1_i1.p1  ORF type:complete len:286 (+),score=38.33 TRINITY_DN6951_c0_g1_i1:64-921(+)
MACAHVVMVKNTFINLLENNEDDDAAFPRQWSDPLPRPSFVDTQEQDDTDAVTDAELAKVTDALESPRTSVGCDDSASDCCSREEWSSVDTPVMSPRAQTLPCAPPGRFDAAGVVLHQDVFGEFGRHAIASPIDVPSEWQGKTSVMVRNISYQCSQIMFCEELNKAGFQGQYDYVYVPINAVRGTSKGYAFANFVDDRTAYRFKMHFDGVKMNVPGSVKRLEIIPANLQGYAQNASHYMAKQSEVSTASSIPAVVSEEQPTRSCHQCQAKVPIGARFCQWCGVGL